MSFENVQASRSGPIITVKGRSVDYPPRCFVNPNLTGYPTDQAAYNGYQDVPALQKQKKDVAGVFKFEFNVGDAAGPFLIKLVNAYGKGESLEV